VRFFCQIFVKALERKRRARPLLQAFPPIKWHQITVLQTNELCSSATRLSLFPASHRFRFPAVQTTPRQRLFYNVKYLEGSKEYTEQCKI